MSLFISVNQDVMYYYYYCYYSLCLYTVEVQLCVHVREFNAHIKWVYG